MSDIDGPLITTYTEFRYGLGSLDETTVFTDVNGDTRRYVSTQDLHGRPWSPL